MFLKKIGLIFKLSHEFSIVLTDDLDCINSSPVVVVVVPRFSASNSVFADASGSFAGSVLRTTLKMVIPRRKMAFGPSRNSARKTNRRQL